MPTTNTIVAILAFAYSTSAFAQVTTLELSIWQDPKFKKAFAQSYMAETDIEPRVTENEREDMLEILSLISEEKMTEAAQLIVERQTESSSATFDFTLANIYFQQERLSEAAEAYQTAVEKFPKLRRAWKNLSFIFVREGDYAKALPALTKVVELGGADATTYGLLGFGYLSVEDYLSAESAYRMAILLDPKSMDWKMGLARALFKQERFADTIALAKQLIVKHPDRDDLWMLQANACIGLGKAEQAAENFEIIDQLGKSTRESLSMLGDIYVNKLLFDLAVDAYSRAMTKSPRVRPERLVRAAKVMVARGATSETRTLISKIQQSYGTDVSEKDRKDLLKIQARLAVAAGEAAEEAKILEEIVKLDPLDGDALIMLGQYYGREGDLEKATFQFERAASIEKFEADAKVRHGQLLVTQGKYNEALLLLKNAQQLKPRENVQEYIEQVERVAKGR